MSRRKWRYRRGQWFWGLQRVQSKRSLKPRISVAERPADPRSAVRDWRDHCGSRSIPLSAECESSTVIPSTLYAQTRTHLYTNAPRTHSHQGLRVWEGFVLFGNCLEVLSKAKGQPSHKTSLEPILLWSATFHRCTKNIYRYSTALWRTGL